MANFGANLELIPVFLRAADEFKLIELMVLNNQLNQMKYNYIEAPKQEKKGTWIAWFYADIKEWQDPSDLNEDEASLVTGFKE